MSETLALRVKRLLTGSANIIVSAVEDLAPELIMEEAIREVDQAIDDVRGELGQVLTRQYHAGQRLATENRRHGELTQKIRLALAEGREDLAEHGVANLLDIEAQIPVVEAALTETRGQQTELEAYVVALQARRREMQEELQHYRSARASAAGVGSGANAEADGTGAASRAGRASAAFDRALERAGGIATGGAIPDRESARRDVELEELARRNRVRERLATMKGGN